MFGDEMVAQVMELAGLTRDDWFVRERSGRVVEAAAELGLVDKGLGLLVLSGGEEFAVTLDVEGVRMVSDTLDARHLEWAGMRGDAAIRGVLTVAEREGRALTDRLYARFVRTSAPF